MRFSSDRRCTIISEEAGISVGLIYRYFTSKEAVIAAMAEEHKKDLQELLERARSAPTLLDSLEILLTAHCCEDAPQIHAAFVVDLFAEAGRNPGIANLVRDILETGMAGVTEIDRAGARNAESVARVEAARSHGANFLRLRGVR